VHGPWHRGDFILAGWVRCKKTILLNAFVYWMTPLEGFIVDVLSFSVPVAKNMKRLQLTTVQSKVVYSSIGYCMVWSKLNGRSSNQSNNGNNIYVHINFMMLILYL
jgi:hypothetical protein